MHHLLFSISAVLGADIVSEDYVSLGTLEDVICNKNSGEITFLIISAGGYLGLEDRLYAIHHSHFYLNGDDEVLILDAKTRGEDIDRLPPLPEHYEQVQVLPAARFFHLLDRMANQPGHRSDTDEM